MAKMYQEKFDREGFEFEIASGGPEGLEKAENLKPHAILLDLVMPGMDGWEVLARLKANPQTKGIPVLILSNLPKEPSALDKSKELGALEYLQKSDYTPQELIDQMRKTLKMQNES